MKIQVEVDIFGDPKYCNNNTGQCPYSKETIYGAISRSCTLFPISDIKLIELNIELGNKFLEDRYLKHDQCKKAYQKKIANTGNQ